MKIFHCQGATGAKKHENNGAKKIKAKIGPSVKIAPEQYFPRSARADKSEREYLLSLLSDA